MDPVAPVLVHIRPGTRAHPAVLLPGAVPGPVAPVAEMADATTEIVCGVAEPELYSALGGRSSRAEVNAVHAALERFNMAHVAGPRVLCGVASSVSLEPLLERVDASVMWRMRDLEVSRAQEAASHSRSVVRVQSTRVLSEFTVSTLRDALAAPYCRLDGGDLWRALDDVCARVVATSDLMRDVKTMLVGASKIYKLGWCVDHDIAGGCAAGDCRMAHLDAYGVTDEDCETYASQMLRRQAGAVKRRLLGRPPGALATQALVAAVKERACERKARALEAVPRMNKHSLGNSGETVSSVSATIDVWSRKMVEVRVEALRLLFDGLFAPAGGNFARHFWPLEIFQETGTA